MKLLRSLILCIVACAALQSCNHRTPAVNADGNSIYYWRTTFSLSGKERDFLHTHNIRKMYVRFFDVDWDYGASSGDKIVPQATIQFFDSVPSGIQVVPTVYITIGAMSEMEKNEDIFAEKIYKRVSAICNQNKITFNELQLDCDWNKSTRKTFFKLCEAMKQYMDSTQALSSTIRLHQLTQDAPPVDKGVLMVYNTGNLMQMTTENSIFSKKDIEPYLRDNRLANYPLPLDVAYPTYGWSVVFEPGNDGYHFSRLMRRSDFSSYPQIKKVAPNLYEANADVEFSKDNDGWDGAHKWSRIRVERPSASEILAVKKLIDGQLKNKPHNTILYHLDQNQLSHYSDDEISQFYTRN